MNSEEEESDINTMEEVKEKELYFRHLNPEKLENKDFLKYVKSVGFVSEYLENKILFDEDVSQNRKMLPPSSFWKINFECKILDGYFVLSKDCHPVTYISISFFRRVLLI